MSQTRSIVVTGTILLGSVLVGCERSTMMPNADPTLNRPRAALVAEAQARFPHPADRRVEADARARAEIGYGMGELRIVNLSGEAWSDVAVWVNGTHVVSIPTWASSEAKRISFKHLSDLEGKPFDTAGGSVLINSIELDVAGELRPVPMQIAR